MLVALLIAVIVAALLVVRPDVPAALLEKKYAAPDTRFAQVDGLRLHYRDRGSGPAMLMIHGVNANHHSFAGWMNEFSMDHRVIAIDLPGHGLTGPDPQHRYHWAGMAERVHALVELLGLDGFVLCGNSLGGAVGLEYALAHAERLRALVLIDSIGFRMREARRPEALAAAATPLLGAILTVTTPRSVVRQVLRSTYGDPDKVSEADVDVYYDMIRRAGNRRAAREILLGSMDERLAGRVHEIGTPTLVLWGDKDTWVPPRFGDWFAAELPNATLTSFPGLGHLPMSEAPGATAAAVRDFLARL